MCPGNPGSIVEIPDPSPFPSKAYPHEAYRFADVLPTDNPPPKQVKHKYRVATPETQRKSAQIISINYPLLSIHNLMQRLIKLLPADISLIRTMPYHIQIMKRQMQLPGEFPCKESLPCPGTTNHYYSLHISYVSVYQVFVKGVEHCREVAFASVGENHYDILTLVLLSLGYRQGCR